MYRQNFQPAPNPYAWGPGNVEAAPGGFGRGLLGRAMEEEEDYYPEGGNQDVSDIIQMINRGGILGGTSLGGHVDRGQQNILGNNANIDYASQNPANMQHADNRRFQELQQIMQQARKFR